MYDTDGRRTDKRFVSSIPESHPYIALMVSCGGGDSRIWLHVALGGLVEKRPGVEVSLDGLVENRGGDQEQS